MIGEPFDPDGLWLKARMFINRALDEDREFEESAFWAACALELLAKAALAKVSPFLIAQHSDNGENVLIASGLIPNADRFVSIQARAVWARSARLFKPFNAQEAANIASGRNEYLHGANVGFDSIPPHAWWPRFWAQAVILVEHIDREVEEFVGRARVPEVDAHLQTVAEYRKRRLESLVQSAKRRLAIQKSGVQSAQFAADWLLYQLPFASHQTEAACPACGEEGVIFGDEVTSSSVEYDDVSPWGEAWGGPSVSLEVSTNGFTCPNCHLSLNDVELILEADLPDAFDAEGDMGDVSGGSEYMDE
ncbi:hypothetical protein B0I08_102180 [Glaciihabitans tibetensis]|uniref:Uncharacterized protein n=1 Tax=Glaciihabitans tibetensis TaxID=1266600 RepID=A0A2T0VH52_9MICO|nr:hypothetical protein [Glaciihabitans tibetensis]PRY69505.1 hypothetical protein B0I08_102180 [Glaciihabitans tibetensis]